MIKAYFTDDTTYSAEDFNTAISCLFSSGIKAIGTGDNVIDSFNDAVSQAVSEGVDTYIDNSCKVFLDGEIYKINAGVCICPGGAIMVIDDLYEIEQTVEPGNYIYVKHNVLHNTVEIVVSDTEDVTDTVRLAYINKDGSVDDRRKFAMAKVALSSSNQYKQISDADIVYYTDYDTAVANPTITDVGFAGFNYVYTKRTSVYSSDTENILIDVSDGKEHQIDTNGSYNTQLYIKKQGSKLIVYGVRLINGGTTLKKSFLVL